VESTITPKLEASIGVHQSKTPKLKFKRIQSSRQMTQS
jgi:hypothetical protein